MIDLATIRPDDWNLPLFLHVLGAFTLVGALVMAASYLFAGRGGSVAMARLGYRSLLLGALPAFIVTRVAAQWIASEEGVEDSDAAWIGIGYMSTDIGVIALIVATVAAGLAVRRAAGGRGVSIAAWLVALLIAVYAVAIWAMATKPV